MQAHNFKNLTNERFGRLVAKKYFIKGIGHNKITLWECKCDCGKTATISRNKLVSGWTKSCGCLHKDLVSTHKLSRTPIYKIWISIRSRCLNDRDQSYKNYGGRGIMCLWNNFEEFKEDMYESYLEHCKEFGTKQTSIDRINNDGNYCKENCQWATRKEQANNTRKTIFLIFNGETKSLSEWTKTLKLNYINTYQRIKRYGWSIEKALNSKI